MKRFILNLWIFLGLSLEFLAFKTGIIKCFDYLDVPRFSDLDNMGGTTTKFYYALASDVLTWPTLPDLDEATDIDDLQVLTGSLAMKEGKKFFTGYMTPDTGAVTSNDQGEVDGVSQKHVFKLFHPKMAARLLGFIRATNNQGMVFVVPDANGTHFMIGNEQFPALKDPSGEAGTGEGTAGRNGATLSFFSYGKGPVPILPDTITVPLTPAINA
jgi:hypothetical protein